MRIGFAISIVLHAALLAWVLVSIRSGREFKKPEIVPVALDIITADELARMKQGDQKAKDKPADAVKDQTGPAPKEQPKPKPVAAAPPPPPPPPPPVAKPEPPPEDPAKLLAEMKKSEPPPPPPPPEPEPAKAPQKPDDILNAMKESEPKPQAAPEPLKTEPPKVAEKPKPKPLPPKPKPPEKVAQAPPPPKVQGKPPSTFDAQRIADAIKSAPDDAAPKAMISKEKPKPAASQTAAATPAPNPAAQQGDRSGRDNQLSGSELAALIYAIRSQVQPCWNVLGGAVEADKIVVRMRVRFKQDGSIVGHPQVLDSQNTPFFLVAADRAVGAVMQCQPYNLPADKYGHWQDVILRFDPREMF